MAIRIWIGGDGAGPNDYGVAANWTGNQVPGIGDDVIIPANTPGIYAGLNQFAAHLHSFRVDPGYTESIGSAGNPLQLTMKIDACQFAGTGTAYLELAVNTIAKVSPVIAQCGLGSAGVYGLQIKSAVIDTLLFAGTGKLGLGTDPGDTTSKADVVDMSGGGTLDIGAVIQASAGDPDLTISHPSAVVNADCDMNEVNVYKGTYRQRTGVWSDLKAHEGKVFASSDPGVTAFATTELDAKAALYNNENNAPRTFTDIVMADGATWMDPSATGSYTNIDFPHGMASCTLDFGPGRRVDVNNIP